MFYASSQRFSRDRKIKKQSERYLSKDPTTKFLDAAEVLAKYYDASKKLLFFRLCDCRYLFDMSELDRRNISDQNQLNFFSIMIKSFRTVVDPLFFFEFLSNL